MDKETDRQTEKERKRETECSGLTPGASHSKPGVPALKAAVDLFLEFAPVLKPILNWANICIAEHSSEYSSNFTSFLN